MITEFALFVSLILFIFLTFYKRKREFEGLPPGDWGLPLIGVIPKKGIHYRNYLKKQGERFGNIFSVKYGSRLIVVINKYEDIKDAVTKQEFAYRPDFATFGFYNARQNFGLTLGSGKIWEYNRRFAIKHLRNFGLGKTSMECIVLNEVEELINNLDKTTESPTSIDWSLNVSVLNIVWRITADRRYEVHDKESKYFAGLLSEDIKIRDGNMMFADYYPILLSLPNYIQNWLFRRDELERNIKSRNTFLMNIIKEHRNSINKEDPRDYIDAFLIDKESLLDQKIDFERDPEMRNLLSCVINLFNAASETVASTLRWFFLYMAVYPEIQEKAQKQIDNLIPDKNRLPILQDKIHLPYVEALSYEMLRITTIAPWNLPHSAYKDTEFKGYRIPKGTVILTGLDFCHHNPKHWEKPEELYPEHFLDDDGKFSFKNRHFLPFSSGKRICVGDSLAKMELFLFISGILQNFLILPAPNMQYSLEPDPKVHFLNVPSGFKIILRRRKKPL